MKDAHDPLEAELAALRPHEASPELRQRIADQLTRSPLSRSRRLWGLALAGGLAAACLAAAILLGWRNDRGVHTRRTIVSPSPVREVEDALPTLQAYAQALARSPEELDALLDRHARLAPERNRQPAPVYALARSERDRHPWIGEP